MVFFQIGPDHAQSLALSDESGEADHSSRHCDGLDPDKSTLHHIATSRLALIEWWLENTMSPPASQMGKIYKALIVDATLDAVAGF